MVGGSLRALRLLPPLKLVGTQIASQCWANVGILLATSLDQRWQITLAQRDFAHQAFVGPTVVCQQSLQFTNYLPTVLQRILC
jgi:hypothetical protein